MLHQARLMKKREILLKQISVSQHSITIKLRRLFLLLMGDYKNVKYNMKLINIFTVYTLVVLAVNNLYSISFMLEIE